VVVDCGQTEHLDGCVSRILLALKLALKQAGGSLRLRGESSEIRKYLGWAGMAAHFPGEESPAITRKRRKRARKPTA
jgi:anti-anti-sigma regulatory factor